MLDEVNETSLTLSPKFNETSPSPSEMPFDKLFISLEDSLDVFLKQDKYRLCYLSLVWQWLLLPYITRILSFLKTFFVNFDLKI